MIRRSWTQTASIEETLAIWVASLREIKQRIRPLFKQERVAANAGLFLEGLLGDEQRKTGWMRAEAAGDPGPWRQQAILGRRDWDADALRDIVRDYVIEHLADDDAVLVIDNTPVRRARLRTARSVSSLPMFRVMVMRSSIARYTFRRNGPTIQIVWKPPMCPPTPVLRPNQSLRRE
jgi:DDE superfamily endonuclease